MVNKRIVNPKALTFEQSGGDEAASDPPSDDERLRAPLNISDGATLDSFIAPRAGEVEVQEAPEPSAEAGQTDVGLPNPAIGSQPLGPSVAQRDAVELAASRQGYDMMVEGQNRSQPPF